jgi:acetylornithine/LysW-gamma-L-lysine aminotransferase
MSTGTTTDHVIEIETRHSSGVYRKRDVVIVRGEGARIWDADGNAYIDCTAGHGVANVGHAHPRIRAAIETQSARIITCPASFPNDRRAELLERLPAVTPDGLDRFFLCNSGTEAVEAALKFARLATGRPGFVATMRGFHGRTLGALSTTWEKKYRAPFQPLIPGVQHVPYDKPDKLLEAVDGETAAVIIEIIQGEGGVRPGSRAFFDAARRACDEHGAMLVVDEVQTGFGRTGRLFACEHHDLRPDILCMGKAMAGGLPMGAVAIGPRVGPLPPGSHGSTFGGNPLCCAAAVAVLDILRDEDLVARADKAGARLRATLAERDLPRVREIRGLGLMIGIELRDRVTSALAGLRERGVLALAAGPNVLRLLPPLCITDDELVTVADAVSGAITASAAAGDA